MRSFHKLIKGASAVDLVAIFDVAAQLTRAEKSSYDRYSSSVQDSFDKHLDFVSERIMEAIRVSQEEEDTDGQEDPDAEDEKDSPGSA